VEATARVAPHPLAGAAFSAVAAPGAMLPPTDDATRGALHPRGASFDAVVRDAVQLALAGEHLKAARIVEAALGTVAQGDNGWLLPIEPLLHVTAHPEAWLRTLTQLRNRAA
jgi:hypothetical protein